MKKTLLIMISSGFSIRNYIRSNLVYDLQKKFNVVVMLPNVKSKIEEELKDNGLNVIKPYQDSWPPYLNFIHTILNYAHNRKLGLWHIAQWQYDFHLSNSRAKIFLFIINIFSFCFQFNTMYNILKKIFQNKVYKFCMISKNNRLIEKISPDLIISTNAYELDEIVISIIAQQKKIETYGSIMSWDNLSYKGFIIPSFNKYLVWSDLMKNELVLSDDKIQKDNIFSLSSIQFDFHFRKEMVWSKRRFYKYLGLNNDNKILLYSASSNLHFIREPEFVEKICERILDGEFFGQPNLILRIHPHDNTDRFDYLTGKYPFLHVIRPWKKNEKYYWWFEPSTDDIALLTNCLKFADVNISAWSTVVLDAAALDLPSVCLAFALKKNSISDNLNRRCIEFGHTKVLYGYKAVKTVYDMNELVNAVNSYIQKPSLHKKERNLMLKGICGEEVGNSYNKYLNLICNH